MIRVKAACDRPRGPVRRPDLRCLQRAGTGGKIAELAQRVVALQAGRDAEIKSLRAEVERLQNELAKVKK